jgi:hypothetical protein
MPKNEIATSLTVAERMTQYDTHVKNILANKVILSWIMRRTVKELDGMSLDEIQDCIEGEPEISLVPVHPGETNAEKITGLQTEDAVPNEGVIYYDIRFFVRLPQERGHIKMIINLEAQKSFYPGYEIVTRGVFYAARELSAQLGTEFQIPRYQDIKKSYSIWLCMNAPQKIGNAISEYSLTKNDIIPGIPDRPKAYDKLSVIVICLNRQTRSDDEFIQMMNTLLDKDCSPENKIRELEETFHISMKNDLGKDVTLMCNLSEYVLEEGIKQGIEQGIEQGELRHKKATALHMLEDGLSLDKVCKYSELTMDEVLEIQKEMMAKV